MWLRQENISSSAVQNKVINDHMKEQLDEVQVHQFVLSQKVGSQSTKCLQRTTLLSTGVMKCKVMELSKRDKKKLF
jgi:hypothetical protein